MADVEQPPMAMALSPATESALTSGAPHEDGVRADDSGIETADEAMEPSLASPVVRPVATDDADEADEPVGQRTPSGSLDDPAFMAIANGTERQMELEIQMQMDPGSPVKERDRFKGLRTPSMSLDEPELTASSPTALSMSMSGRTPDRPSFRAKRGSIEVDIDDDIDIDDLDTDDEVPFDSVEPTTSHDVDAFAAVASVTEEGSDMTEEMAAKDGETSGAEHATIAEVTESAPNLQNPANTKEDNVEEVIAKIKDRLPCESVVVLDYGEIMVLPKGWSTRASKTHGGKEYFVSPYGQTQWLRPPMKTGIGYRWIHEIEVTFGPGLLGLNLKQITAEPGAIFTDIPVHIQEIYKLSNGMASPAEIYNWGAKPEKRLQAGMRVTAMNGVPVTGCTYFEVLDRVNRLPRPLRIKFANIEKGIVGRAEEVVEEEETEEEKEARKAREHQINLRQEYFQILVTYELHLQVWEVTRGFMESTEMQLSTKSDMVSNEVDALHEFQELLRTETESLIHETASLENTVEQLKLQELGQIESPEEIRETELQERNTALANEIKELIAENEQLRLERVALDASLDSVHTELEEYEGLDDVVAGVDYFSPAFLGQHVDRGSINFDGDDAKAQLLERIRKRRSHMKADLAKTEEQIRQAESNIAQFKKDMAVTDAAIKREDDLISGDKPPQLISLEDKIRVLRQDLRETVAKIAAATKANDRAAVDNLSIRRSGIKTDLKNAMDEMQIVEEEFNVRSTISRKMTSESQDIARSLGRHSFSASTSNGSSFGDDDNMFRADKPEELISLERKISTLRKELRSTKARVAAATKAGNRATADNLLIRQEGIEEDLKRALAEMQLGGNEVRERLSTMSSQSLEIMIDTPVTTRASEAQSSRSSVQNSTRGVPATEQQPVDEAARLKEKLASLRVELHKTVEQMSKSARAKDEVMMKLMSAQRLQIKQEMKVVQDEYQALTKEVLAPPPASTPSSSRGSMQSRFASSLPPRPPVDRPSLGAGRDRAESRSSTSTNASHASMSLSADSHANQPSSSKVTREARREENESTIGEGGMPLFTGLLMKHPSHSNERSVFGNMSLRGVRERYCVLDGSGVLKYYKRQHDHEPRGIVPLDDPALEVVYSKTELKNSAFSICTPTHQNRFVAKTHNEMLKWVNALELTHELLMQRMSKGNANRLQGRESVASVNGGAQGNESMAMAMAFADALEGQDRPSLTASRTSSAHDHRATLGF